MKKIISNLLLIISIFGVIFSCTQLYKIYHEYHSGTVAYDELQTNLRKIEKNKKEKKEIKLKINFKRLQSINKNCIGWVYIPDTQIDYPIIQSHDDEYVLHHLIDGTRNFTGCIFVSENNHKFADKNTIIYGHNMQNGTMFTDINKYKKQSFYKNHKYIYLAKPNGKTEKYKIFSAYTTTDGSSAYNTYFTNDTFIKYVNKYINKSEIKVKDVSISDNDKIITLSTCTSRVKLERFVVHAVKIK